MMTSLMCAECMENLVDQHGELLGADLVPAITIVQGYAYCEYHALFYLGHREVASRLGPPAGVDEAFDGVIPGD